MPSWGELLSELQPHIDSNGQMIKGLNHDELRTKYLDLLSQKTGRNIIAYYSGWLKPGKTQNIDINDSDITGFMNAIKGLDDQKGLDLILHTPGGSPTATEGIVKYLHSKFRNDIRVFIPQMAMSAGTMLACSAHTIVMGKHSCLGPIDPQYGGIPAYNIVNEFHEAHEELKRNPQAKTYWEIQLRRYPSAFYYSVLDAINLSGSLLSEWLSTFMFGNEDDKTKKEKVDKIVSVLNANNSSHSRHFSYDDCHTLGLNVIPLESDHELQELVLSVHHSFVITIDASTATKLIENHIGSRYITNQNR